MLLIGIVHYDLEGPRRLMYILERRKPEKISVEYPGKSIEEVEKLLEEKNIPWNGLYAGERKKERLLKIMVWGKLIG